jgi:regulator of cell morphogenesis and NO signaling
MFNVQGKTVREIALEMPLTTRVFEEYKIDYCCHGDTLFAEACQSVGVLPEVVNQEINSLVDESRGSVGASIANMPLNDLIDHILDKHHVYTRDEMAHLTPLMAKVATRHGDHYQYLLELKGLFEAVCDDLEPHMVKEEMVLFPYIRDLDYRNTNNMTAAFPPFGTVQHPIKMMSVEHEEVGGILAKMRAVTND